MTHLDFVQRLFNFSEETVQTASFYGGIMGTFITLVSAFSESYLGISGILFILLFVIMVTDYITGLRASKKEGVKFISKKGLGWVFKLGSYIVFLGVSFLLRKEMISDGLTYMEHPMTAAHFYVLIHIMYWEMKSVDENFERLGYDLRILKLFDELFMLLKSIFKKKLTK